MAGIGPIRQDWEPVVVRKKAPNAAANKDEKAVNAARRSGAEIDTTKKCIYPHFSFAPFFL
jgi:putative transcription factor